MARFAISEEGAEAMSQLSNDIRSAYDGLKQAGVSLKSNILGSMNDLGVYGIEIWSIALNLSGILEDNEESFFALADAAKKKSDDIRNMIGSIYSSGTVSDNSNSSFQTGIKPLLDRPRVLERTQFGFVNNGKGELVYDSPQETGQYLYSSQGSANENYQGTCGLCSCANILRLAGVNYNEQDMIDYASTTGSSRNPLRRLCVVGKDPESNGGTNPRSRQEILEHFGVESDVVPIDMDQDIASDKAILDIAECVAAGKGVILSVHAGVLYEGRIFEDDFHAVTVTSVTKNKYGDITGFYICDSNVGTSYYSVLQIKNALTGAAMNVSRHPIR